MKRLNICLIFFLTLEKDFVKSLNEVPEKKKKAVFACSVFNVLCVWSAINNELNLLQKRGAALKDWSLMWVILEKQGRRTRWSWERSILLRSPEARLSIFTWNYCCTTRLKVHPCVCLIRSHLQWRYCKSVDVTRRFQLWCHVKTLKAVGPSGSWCILSSLCILHLKIAISNIAFFVLEMGSNSSTV